MDVDGKVTLCVKKIKLLLKQELLDEAYRKYSKIANYVEEPDYEIHVDDPHQNCTRLMTTDEFINICKTDTEFSQRWGLKIEERELSLEERYGLSRVNGISPKYSFEIEDGKPTPNKMSESEWYDNHNIPTKLIKVTYNDKTIEMFLP